MMEWVTNQDPFFRTKEDAAAYVESEVRASMTEGWEITRSSEDGLSWCIEKPGRWMENYRVQVSGGLDFVFFFYGNSDHGCFALHHVLQTALVIETRALRGFGLRECVHRLFEEQPNRLGRT